MAALLLKDLSSGFLECQICLQPFRKPKILPCLHTFCKECLAEYTKPRSADGDQIECPTCRSKSPLPGGTIDGFKDDFLIERLKETVNLHKTLHSEGQEIVCSNPYCDSKGIATSLCLNCDELLCGECVAAHRRIKVTRDHKVSGLDELRGKEQVRQGEKHTCDEHPEEVIKIFCETCEVPMCLYCALLKHKEHSFTHLKDHSTLVRAEVQGKIEQVKAKADEYRALCYQLQNQLEDEKEAEADIDYQIVDVASKLKEAIISEIDRQKESLRAENRKISAFRQKLLSSEKNEAESKLAYIGSTMEFAEKRLSYGSDYEITVVGSDTKERLETLGAEDVPSIGQMSPRAFNETTEIPSFKLGSVHGEIEACKLKLPCGHSCGDKHIVGRCKTSCFAQIKLKCGHQLGSCYEVGDVNKISCSKGHQIFIQLQSERRSPRTVTINDVSLNDSVASMKKRCCGKIEKGDATLSLTLVFAGKTLRDDLTLGDYGIGFQSTLFLHRSTSANA